MSTRRPTTQELRLLNDVVKRRAANLEQVLNDVVGEKTLSAAEANLLRDAIGDELAATGIHPESGAVNERGHQLDELIDLVAGLSSLYDE